MRARGGKKLISEALSFFFRDDRSESLSSSSITTTIYLEYACVVLNDVYNNHRAAKGNRAIRVGGAINGKARASNRACV